MPSAQEIKQQQEKLDEILKQQEIVADSVKRYKIQQEELNKATAIITKSNSDLQVKTDDIQKNIDFLNDNLEKRKQETKNFEIRYKAGVDELDTLEKTIEQKNLELTEMEKEATEKIKVEVENLQSKVDELDILKKSRDEEIIVQNNNIAKLNGTVSTLNDSITILKSQASDQKKIVDNETININELTKEVDKLKDQIESYTDVLDVIKQDIKDSQAKITELGDIKKELENLLVDFNKKVESANAEFDELSTKSRILIERGEYQEGQAVFLKEQFEKIGRDYQPYQP